MGENRDCSKSELLNSLANLDSTIDRVEGNPSIVVEWDSIMKKLGDVCRFENEDLAQKDKIKWVIEGDKNSKFFHGVLNKKRKYLAIRGILIDNEWVDEPNRVKA